LLAGLGLLRQTSAAAFAFPMLIWVPLMGAGVVGGFLLMAAAGDQAGVPVAVAVTGLGVLSSILAAAALVRPRSSARLPRTARHPAWRLEEDQSWTHPRPLGAAVAAAFLGVAALAGLIFGPYLVVLGMLISNDLGGDQGTVVLTLEVMLGIGCLLLGAIAALTARGLLRLASWAWAAALFVGLVLVVATAVVFIEDRWQTTYALIGALGALVIVALWPGSVRRAFGM
jgi:hypothetical protein